MNTTALIFDMDGTMIDSMPFHARSWMEFTRRHSIEIDVAELLRRTTGCTGAECIPAIFLEAAKRMGVDAAQCIVFEDAPLGIEAARRAGMRAVGVCTSHSAEELAGPHVLAHVRDYTELLNSNFLETLHVA